jgi:hypothetical protein
MTAWAERRRVAALERDHERQVALTVACPSPPHGCDAPAGKDCRNLRTGLPLEHQVAHRQRVIRGEQQAAARVPVVPEQQRGGGDGQQ